MDELVAVEIADPVPPEEGSDAPRGPALSPSRAADFMTCPLLYRFRVIDKLPEPPTAAAARGTLVHAVLERLFDLSAAMRTPAAARSLVQPEWDRLSAAQPDLAALFPGEAERDAWIRDAAAAVDSYFRLEDPRRLEPADRELYVEAELESGLRLRGYIDRLDVAPAGDIRVVDYKTGKAPPPDFEARALFQMKFYALVLWRARGQIPRLLQLMYLGDGQVVRYAPDEADLRATERKVQALWQAIERARDGRGLAAAARPPVRVVRAQDAVPGVRRHAAASSLPGPCPGSRPGSAGGPGGTRRLTLGARPPADGASARGRRRPGGSSGPEAVQRWGKGPLPTRVRVELALSR